MLRPCPDAAQMVIGRHDFSAFRAKDKSRPDESPIVVVEEAGIETEGDLIIFHITASHFVWRMVRRVVGALVKLGLGEITEDDFAGLLEGKTDSKLDVAAWTAPASGLFLDRVIYPEPGGPEQQPPTRESRQGAAGGAGVAGASSPAAPLNTFLPDGKVTIRALAVLVPSLARRPWTITSSPTFRSFFLHPRRTSSMGAPVSNCQWSTPASVFTST